MATRIWVPCRSREPVRFAEIVDVMGHWGALDHPARFEPALDAANRERVDWDSVDVEVEVEAGKRPITVSQYVTPDEMQPALASLRDRLEDLAPDDARTLQDWIDTATRVFEFEVPGDPPDDVWEMLAITQSFLARERDGIVVADEAAYDADLNQLFTF